MNTVDHRIDQAARAFNEAAAALAEVMLEKLHTEAPAVAMTVAAGLHQGERLVLAMEMDLQQPAIWWAIVDDYQNMRRIMTIPAGGRSLQ